MMVSQLRLFFANGKMDFQGGYVPHKIVERPDPIERVPQYDQYDLATMNLAA